METTFLKLIPVKRVSSLTPYNTPKFSTAVDMFLDGNEGVAPSEAIMRGLESADPELLRRYPTAGELEELIAKRHRLNIDQVIVTCGADEALDRVCRMALQPGRNIILPTPAFAMLKQYAQLAGATIITVPWFGGEYPVEQVIQAIDNNTSVIAVVTPNNPTGAVATTEDVRRLAEAAPQCLLLVDQAYVEFSDNDLTDIALKYSNTVVVRSLSKAWGLAGLRIGYALGASATINWLRVSGGPYSVSGLSLHLAKLALGDSDDNPKPMKHYIRQVKTERTRLTELLHGFDVTVTPSEANFVLARFKNSEWVKQGLAGFGIAVHSFPDDVELAHYLRITCPGETDAFDRVEKALVTIFKPEALLFDLDGVLANVSLSYHRAITLTLASYGVTITPEDIQRQKAGGGENNDWRLTWTLLKLHGVGASLSEVISLFESIYQGNSQQPGLWEAEELLASPDFLKALSQKHKLGIVTGRPRVDCERFLRRFGIDNYFSVVVCMEDAPDKPNPQGLQLAMKKLGVNHAWYFGDTPGDMRAARGASALPIGVFAPTANRAEMGRALYAAGAGTILNNVTDIERTLNG